MKIYQYDCSNLEENVVSFPADDHTFGDDDDVQNTLNIVERFHSSGKGYLCVLHFGERGSAFYFVDAVESMCLENDLRRAGMKI
jgi:hypothetical protein